MIMVLNFAIAIVSNAFDQVNAATGQAVIGEEFGREIRVALKKGRAALCGCIPEKQREALGRAMSNLFGGDQSIPHLTRGYSIKHLRNFADALGYEVENS